MPVIVPPGEYDWWLDTSLHVPDSIVPLLVPFPPEEMLAFPVSLRSNAPPVDDEGCIAPLL
jgi:putative SOS response-associated peptidase YedK